MKEFNKKLIYQSGLSTNSSLNFFCNRRNGGAIFFDEYENIYVKIGEKVSLKKEYDIQRELLEKSFQVAKILGRKEIGNNFMYSENAMGKLPVGQLIHTNELSYNEGVSKLYNISQKHFLAQSKTINTNGDIEKILKKSNIHLLKEEEILDDELYLSLISKLFKDLLNNLYYSINHGDFNSMNIFEKGIIDLEDVHNGPVGFDLVTLLSNHYWFDTNGEIGRRMLFSFKVEDVVNIVNMYNKISPVKIEKTFDLCFILRSIWSVVGLNSKGNELNFRLKRFKIYLKKYLDGDSLYDYFLEEIDTIN